MYGILVDVTRCAGCEKCVTACCERNGCDLSAAQYDRAVVADGLSAHRLSTVLKVGEGRFARKSCMHCLEPACVSACLVGGLTKTAEGPVLYNRDKCIGCRYCMLACPFHIPRYQWERTIPYVVKCDMCADRLARKEEPACVAACPQKALKVGERSQLLREAHLLLQRHPDLYLDHVWGEKDLGGTSVLYISDVDLSGEMGWPAEGAFFGPLPSLSEPLVHKTPFIGLTVGITMIGLNWIIKRRNEVAAQNGRHDRRDGDDHE
jgi:formate dehydrogenase iron-sulfur subunit